MATNLNIFNYPIETPEAIEFWKSEHKCNTAKAFVAFSLDYDNFIQITKRHGYTREWRERMWDAFGLYVNNPDMVGIPFSEIDTPYWDCMPNPNIGTELEYSPYVVALTPSHEEIPEGSPYQLLVVATGAPAVSYQWFKDGNPIPGAVSALHLLDPFLEADNGTYHVVVTNPYGSTTSKEINLLVKMEKPVVTTSPSDQVAEDGTLATFTASATGYDTVQWLEQGIEILGENTPVLLVTADHTASGNSGHNYSAQFTNAGGTTTTPMAELVVTVPVPKVILQPLDVKSGVGEGNTLTLTADAENYDTVQWYKKERLTGKYLPVAGQTTTTFTGVGIYTGFFDEYFAEFTNAYHSIRTRIATVYVASDPVTLLGGFGAGFSAGFE